jgi:hypothetical protein
MCWRPSCGDGERSLRRGRPRTSGRRSALAALAIVGALGCSGPPGAGRTLGTDLGTFQVDATETANDCGPNALGSAPDFDFDVELARADGELFWDGRVGGTLGADLEFELSARVDVELRPTRGAVAGCSVVRSDRITGDLRPDGAGALTAFTGQMRFDFSATPESACTLEELGLAQLSRLPCGMSYTLRGQRTRAPMP